MSFSLPALRTIRLALLLAAGLAAWPAVASTCQRIEAELASLPAGGVTARDARLAGRYRTEAQRIGGEMAALNCQRPRLFIFGEAAAPQCAGLRQRHAQMLAGAAYYGGGQQAASDGRRRQLMAALASNNCRSRSEPQQVARRGVLNAGIFDEDNPGRRREIAIRDDDDDEAPIATRRPVPAAGKAVCVRLCDGYFFPLTANRSRAREDGDEICQSLCPASETKVFFLGSREIDRAVGSEGQTYQSLTNAYRYRQSFDPTCGCRRPGETWAEALRNVEQQTRLRDGDIIVPGGETMTIIGGRASTSEARLRGMEAVGPPLPPDVPVVSDEERGNPAIPLVEGEMREFTGRDGIRRSVRVVSPAPLPAP